jgi:hypothetical protein
MLYEARRNYRLFTPVFICQKNCGALAPLLLSWFERISLGFRILFYMNAPLTVLLPVPQR